MGFGFFAGGLSQGVRDLTTDLRQQQSRQQQFDFNRATLQIQQDFSTSQADAERVFREQEAAKDRGIRARQVAVSEANQRAQEEERTRSQKTREEAAKLALGFNRFKFASAVEAESFARATRSEIAQSVAAQANDERIERERNIATSQLFSLEKQAGSLGFVPSPAFTQARKAAQDAVKRLNEEQKESDLTKVNLAELIGIKAEQFKLAISLAPGAPAAPAPVAPTEEFVGPEEFETGLIEGGLIEGAPGAPPGEQPPLPTDFLKKDKTPGGGPGPPTFETNEKLIEALGKSFDETAIPKAELPERTLAEQVAGGVGRSAIGIIAESAGEGLKEVGADIRSFFGGDAVSRAERLQDKRDVLKETLDQTDIDNVGRQAKLEADAAATNLQGLFDFSRVGPIQPGIRTQIEDAADFVTRFHSIKANTLEEIVNVKKARTLFPILTGDKNKKILDSLNINVVKDILDRIRKERKELEKAAMELGK